MESEVDAIEDGHIVRVTTEYAKKEGLLVLRKSGNSVVIPSLKIPQPAGEVVSRRRAKSPLDLDKYRRPLRKNDAQADLKDNFHWELAALRKSRNLTRKALASAIGVVEEDIKMIENGQLPKDDFVLISTLETYFNANLRRDKNYQEPARKAVEKAISVQAEKDVEIFEEEHDFSAFDEKKEQ